MASRDCDFAARWACARVARALRLSDVDVRTVAEILLRAIKVAPWHVVSCSVAYELEVALRLDDAKLARVIDILRAAWPGSDPTLGLSPPAWGPHVVSSRDGLPQALAPVEPCPVCSVQCVATDVHV